MFNWVELIHETTSAVFWYHPGPPEQLCVTLKTFSDMFCIPYDEMLVRLSLSEEPVLIKPGDPTLDGKAIEFDAMFRHVEQGHHADLLLLKDKLLRSGWRRCVN